MATSAIYNVLATRQQQVGSARQGSNSLSGVLSTVIPVVLLATIVFGIFTILRPKLPRIYFPRSLYKLVRQRDHTSTPPPQAFGYIDIYKSLGDAHVLQCQSLDGYLFLRFLKTLTIICFIGCCITWPVLFPVNATGNGGQSQLDILSMSNVNPGARYFAEAIIAWIYLGIVVVMIARERTLFIGLRHAYYLSSFQAQRLSARTLLFLGVPEDELEENKLRQILGPHVRNIWFLPDCEDLQDLVDERDKLWNKFEKAQVAMISEAEKNCRKHGKPAPADPYTLVDAESRPTHRLKPLIGKKVDTINYGRMQLPRITKEAQESRQKLVQNNSKFLPVAFVEFSSQAAAQEAFQHKVQGHKTEWHPRYVGVEPEEIIWKNLAMSYASRRIKLAIATAVIVLMTIFWTIPTSFIGVLTNINYLINEVPFLSFIGDIPPVILGLVTGLLPSLLLSALMALVPIICRLLAKLAGAPTLSQVELKTQSWYFIFQVIQVFLVTTFTSGAASVVTQIIQYPPDAVRLLANNLPKASNFFMSYITIKTLMAAALILFNPIPLLLIMVLGKLLDKTPRKKYGRWMALQGLGWGSVYPKITNLGVIALSYSCIAPLVLGFATIGFAVLYLGFRYNFLFVYGIKVDMKGESYSRAMQHLLTGVYLSVLCLIGLFAIGTADSQVSIGPLVLMIIFLVGLIVFQVLLHRTLAPKEQHLSLEKLANNPDSLFVESLEATSPRQHELEKKNLSDESPPASGHDHKRANLVARWATSQVDSHYHAYKAIFSTSVSESDYRGYSREQFDQAYQHPAIASDEPFIWLPNDSCGMSDLLLQENRAVGMGGSNQEAWLNKKYKVEWNRYNPHKCPIWEEPKTY